MREFLIITSMLFCVGGYLLHFVGGGFIFGDNFPYDYVWGALVGGALISALGILLEGFEAFFIAPFLGSIAGWALIYHYQYF